MTPEEVSMYARSYRLYFASDTYDFIRYKGHVKTPPLIQQRERQFYYRLSCKLSDAQIHATFLMTHFFKPAAYITDVCTPERMSEGITLVSRDENGSRVYMNDLYTLHKQLATENVTDWLYGTPVGTERASMPDCLGRLIAKELPLDLACLLLLIPQPGYNWTAYWEAHEKPGTSFGVRPWITRLRKADQLLHWQRSSWRQMSSKLSGAFWKHYDTTPPADSTESTLF